MFKIFVFLTLFQLSTLGFLSAAAIAPYDCPSVTNLHKTAQTSNSISYSWSSAYSGAQYKVWYVRQEDSSFSGYFYVSSTSYNFTGLPDGHYTFYFQTLCGDQTSDFIGIEDVVPM